MVEDLEIRLQGRRGVEDRIRSDKEGKKGGFRQVGKQVSKQVSKVGDSTHRRTAVATNFAVCNKHFAR